MIQKWFIDFVMKIIDEAIGYVEAGYRGMKTKVGGLSVADDVARVGVIREAIKRCKRAP